MKIKLFKAYSCFGEAAAKKWAAEGRRGYRHAYWRSNKNIICEWVTLHGRYYACTWDFQGWFSASKTMREAFENPRIKKY